MRLALAVFACFLLALGTLPTGRAQASDALAFTVSVSEPSDTPPQAEPGWDLTEVALAEPGDASVVFRATLAGAPDPGSSGSRLFFGFTTAAGDIVGGCTYAGAPIARNIGTAIKPDSCLVSGALVYATYSYTTAQVKVGDTISKIWGFTDSCAPAGCVPADTAPGDNGPATIGDGWPASTFGTDYPVTGCTNAVCPSSGGTGVQYANLTAPNLSQSFNKTSNGTFSYNFTSPGSDVDLTYNVTPLNGSVHFTVTSPNGTVVLNRSANATATGAQRVPQAMNGTWVLNVTYSNFTGEFRFAMVVHPIPVDPSMLPSSSSSSTSASASKTTTAFPLQHVKKQTPGLPSLAAPAVLVALALASRRRR